MRRYRIGWGVNPSIPRHQTLCSLLFLFKAPKLGRHRGRRQISPRGFTLSPAGLRRRCRPHSGATEILRGSPHPGAYAARLYDFAPFGAIKPWAFLENGHRKTRRITRPLAVTIGMELLSSPAGATAHADSRLDAGRCWIIPRVPSRLDHHTISRAERWCIAGRLLRSA